MAGTKVTGEIDGVRFDTKGLVSRHSETQVKKQSLTTKRMYLSNRVAGVIWVLYIRILLVDAEPGPTGWITLNQQNLS
ncbi:hypothetical protein HID58_041546 [Brassica napus]|uniref:Uncharacterized protein n=1 Tax=Brassica napus TaxID=3708 RepID=A0ABQ8BBH9_BRANA|nr:hypothetical protein HID58_041546 [Brassica napus]